MARLCGDDGRLHRASSYHHRNARGNVYNWRAAAAELNSYPQFTTAIDGVSIQFLDVSSPETDAQPLMLIHVWPGSIAEFQDVVGPLTDPRSRSVDPADALHVVIPSVLTPAKFAHVVYAEAHDRPDH